MGLAPIVISMVTWDRLDATKKCIESVRLRTRRPYKLIITDNGSTDGTKVYLQELWDDNILDAVVYLDKNKGVAQGRNAHWPLVRGHDVMRLDNDVEILSDGWLTTFKDQSDKVHGVIGLCVDCYKKAVQHETENSSGLIPHYEVAGTGFFIPQECVDNLSPWNEEYGMHGYEDLDYVKRCEQLGYSPYLNTTVDFKHLYPEAYGRTQSERMVMRDLFHKNCQLYLDGDKSL